MQHFSDDSQFEMMSLTAHTVPMVELGEGSNRPALMPCKSSLASKLYENNIPLSQKKVLTTNLCCKLCNQEVNVCTF